MKALLIVLALASFASSARADDPLAAHTFENLKLTVTPPKLDGAQFKESKSGQTQGTWTGKLGSVDVQIQLIRLAPPEFHFDEPDLLLDFLLDNYQDAKRGDPSFHFESNELVPGKFGWAPYASLAFANFSKNTEIVGSRVVLCGVTEDEAGWAIEVNARPSFTADMKKTIIDFLKKGVVYSGPVREGKWSDKAASDRWKRDAPDSVQQKKFQGAIRTDHYIILSDSDGAKLFAKKVEECYAEIKKVFPFNDVAGRELLPIFLFKTADEYYDYYAKITKVSLEDAKKSKGHAFRDYYATWYESPGDPVHIHELTHQIFSNRLRLTGGGSWFQEGVAEYMCTQKNDRNTLASAVKKGRHMKLADFMAVKSLLYSAKDDKSGESAAANQYTEGALFVEFVRESKWGAPKFQDYIHAVGAVRRNDVPAIEAAFKRIFGTDIAGVEEQWIEYCKKR